MGDYHVEAIISHRLRKKNVEFEVKWLGYPDSDNTFEPLKNLITIQNNSPFAINDKLIDYLRHYNDNNPNQRLTMKMLTTTKGLLVYEQAFNEITNANPLQSPLQTTDVPVTLNPQTIDTSEIEVSNSVMPSSVEHVETPMKKEKHVKEKAVKETVKNTSNKNTPNKPAKEKPVKEKITKETKEPKEVKDTQEKTPRKSILPLPLPILESETAPISNSDKTNTNNTPSKSPQLNDQFHTPTSSIVKPPSPININMKLDDFDRMIMINGKYLLKMIRRSPTIPDAFGSILTILQNINYDIVNVNVLSKSNSMKKAEKEQEKKSDGDSVSETENKTPKKRGRPSKKSIEGDQASPDEADDSNKRQKI